MKRDRAIVAGFALAAAVGWSLGGCASLAPVAPAVTPAMSGVAPGVPVATLEAGRRTFVTSCTACHHADPVSKHSPAEWREIVAEMSPRTKLNAAQQSALLSYLLAARATAVGPPAG